MLVDLTRQLLAGQALAEEQSALAVEQLVADSVSVQTKADFLSALAQKGETIPEIAAFARILRDKSLPIPLPQGLRECGILDVVGTGGDKLGTFNISTTSALIVAASGVIVAKHGNRAITSQAGSADVLEALGIRIDLTPRQVADMLAQHQFAFLFAPRFHPAFKHIAPARKLCAERGQRTIFNFLGPLLNPVRPSAQLVGVPNPQLCEPIALVLQSLGFQRGVVVCGTANGAFMDELSILGENTIAEFHQEPGVVVNTFKFDGLPLQPATLSDLIGGDRQANADMVRRILRGEDRGPKRDAVLLNAGAALWVAGKVQSIGEGWLMAARLIDNGCAMAKLTELVQASSQLD